MVIIEGISPEIFQIYKVPPLKILEISRIDSLKKLRDKYKRLWYITIYPQDTPFERELFGKFHCLGIRIAPSSTGLIKLFLFDTAYPKLSSTKPLRLQNPRKKEG